MARQLPLWRSTNGSHKGPLALVGHATVDDEDYDRFSQHTWLLATSRSSRISYARRYERHDGKNTAIYLHREVLNLDPDDPRFVDHISRDGLDCQKHNLRLVDYSGNAANQAPPMDSSTGYKGVTRNYQLFQAKIASSKRQVALGCYPTPHEAAFAYDCASTLLHQQHGITNQTLGLLAPETLPSTTRQAEIEVKVRSILAARNLIPHTPTEATR